MTGQCFKLPDERHIYRMTDDTGMLQHAKYTVPDPTMGYTGDDNARALIMAVMFYEITKDSRYLDLVTRYLGFLLYARNGPWFRNFMGYDRRFTEEKGSEDCFGRCVWALGFTASRIDLPGGIRNLAEELLSYVADSCRKLNYLRAKAYALIGLCYWKADCAHDLIVKLSHDIAMVYEDNAVHDWKWFEDEITYCNAVLPRSTLTTYETLKEKRYMEIGIESLGFLLKTTFAGDMFRPVGCKGWYQKGKTLAEFDQQPVEACETMLACLKAYELTGDAVYRSHARQCLMWYTGHNSLNVSLIDPNTGGCMDGLTPQGPNRNEGAESLVSWMIAYLMWAACFGREGEIE